MSPVCLSRPLAVLAVALLPLSAQAGTPQQSFATFVAKLWPDAQAKGITRANFDLAMNGVTPNPRVVAATKHQPEYGRPFGVYVNDIASPDRIKRGKRKAREWGKTLATVRKKFDVSPWILVALWGIESDYGAEKDHWDVFRSLATLAYVGYRDPYFRNELLNAMRMMQDDHIARRRMVSSWAGAMGQTQFMPSNFLDYAIDFSGHGRPDIWTNVPDILASTANYLHKEQWQGGLPWGFEVTVPRGFDYMHSRDTFAGWRKLGVRRADGRRFPQDGNGILFFPAGYRGPAFIITANFEVLKEYNNSDAYAVAVGHLADRMQGGPPIKVKWPTDDQQLSRGARIALQKKLVMLGYKVNDFQGHIDFDLRDNIRSEQKKFGMVPDGNPTIGLLEKLGIKVH